MKKENELNPFEFTILKCLEANKGRRFTQTEIGMVCQVNYRTAKKHSEGLFKKKLIKREKVRGKHMYSAKKDKYKAEGDFQ